MTGNKDIFEIGEFKYVNFTRLCEDSFLIENIRQWRNHPDVRKYMYNDDEISEEEHQIFISSLNKRNDVTYWFVHYKENPIGVVSLVKIDELNKQAELGYYLIPTILNSGLGLTFAFHNFLFAFKHLTFNLLFGAAHINNTNALLLDKYLGCIMGEYLTIKKNGGNRNFLTWTLKKEDFMKDSRKKNDIRLFVQFCRESNIR